MAHDDVKFRTDHVGRWGTGLGRNLTPAEVDENFWNHEERIDAVESNPAQPLEIQSITVIGNKMTITMSDNVTTFGPFTLPMGAFRFTNAFQPNHDYTAFDLFTVNDGLYMVLHDHTSGPTFVFGSDSDGPLYQFLLAFPSTISFGFFFPTKPGFGIATDDYGNGAIFSYLADRDFYLPEDLAGSQALLRVAPTDDVTFPIMLGDDPIGDITFTSGSVAPTFMLVDNVQVSIGQVVRVLRPTELDATAYDLNVTLQGKLGTIPA